MNATARRDVHARDSGSRSTEPIGSVAPGHRPEAKPTKSRLEFGIVNSGRHSGGVVAVPAVSAQLIRRVDQVGGNRRAPPAQIDSERGKEEATIHPVRVLIQSQVNITDTEGGNVRSIEESSSLLHDVAPGQRREFFLPEPEH